MYDIYLNSSCQKLPDIEDLAPVIPLLIDPIFQARLLNRSHVPGVLGLDLSYNLAIQLLERFVSVKSNGYYFPSVYHFPKLTVDQAIHIAQQTMEQYQRTDMDTLGPTFFRGENPVCLVFAATSEKLLKEDRIPGLKFVQIDKLDGHVWSEEEIYRLVGHL